MAQWLRESEGALFWSQQAADQRHGLETARKLAAQRPEDLELIRAGLLHDVGKVQASLGPFRRTFATLAGLMNLPVGERYRNYLEHGPLGADLLVAAGAEGLVVDFARHHPHAAPQADEAERWQLLLAADDD